MPILQTRTSHRETHASKSGRAFFNMSQTQTRTTHLRIYSTPFKPTFLSIPPSPFSPLLPITPSSPPKSTHISQPSPRPHPVTSAPSNPLSWMWQCHLCHRNYHLAATRRCLDDGHEFCSGTTTMKAARKIVRVKRHKACASEFDYSGWKAWGRWKRGGRKTGGLENGLAGLMKKKDCWNTCDYPSECQWGRSFGIHTPLTPAFPTPQVSPPLAEHPEEGVLKAENCKEAEQTESEKSDFWGALIASAKRRKSVTGTSPLAEEVGTSSLTAEVNTLSSFSPPVDSDGDIEMSSSPIPPSLPSIATPTSLTVSSVARDILKDLIKRKTLSRRSKSGRSGLQGGKNCYPVPMLAAPKAVFTKKEEHAGGADPEALLNVEGVEPLVRVRSRRE